MALSHAEFESILADTTKCIRDDIIWKEDEDRSPAREFRVEVESESGWPLSMKGRYNPDAGTLSYALILKATGRIYALDLGKDHHNPQCDQVGDKHKHRWSEHYRDKEAYAPEDISASASEPVSVWREFCMEAGIRHEGTMTPPLIQGEMF